MSTRNVADEQWDMDDESLGRVRSYKQALKAAAKAKAAK
jgi:hypothetical protein